LKSCTKIYSNGFLIRMVRIPLPVFPVITSPASAPMKTAKTAQPGSANRAGFFFADALKPPNKSCRA